MPDTNPLGVRPVGALLREFAIPAIISGLVGALYNIVDQIFIGQGVGILGNAATNVAFPLVNLSLALCLLIGAGTGANFSLNLGRGKPDLAARFVKTGIFFVLGASLGIFFLVRLFLPQLLLLFGTTNRVMDLAMIYTSITSWGIPALMFTVGFSSLIRADGSPRYAMMCTLVGAILNTILDPLFIFGFHWGIAGAAYATIIGQIVSALITAIYFFRMKHVDLSIGPWRFEFSLARSITSLGLSPFINQGALMIFQIVMNNTLTTYGAQSPYGPEIPLAVVGVISKVSVIYYAFIFGISQGAQPIMGFNYGAKNFSRVKEAFFKALKISLLISVIAFFIYQLFPRQILSLFGEGDELYYHFGILYLRIFLMMTCINAVHPVCAFFFTSIGRAHRGMIISMTRQILFLIPLVILFSRLFGVEGVLYAGPIADFAAFSVAGYLAFVEMKRMKRAQEEGLAL